jgi:hypothetical protein
VRGGSPSQPQSLCPPIILVSEPRQQVSSPRTRTNTPNWRPKRACPGWDRQVGTVEPVPACPSRPAAPRAAAGCINGEPAAGPTTRARSVPLAATDGASRRRAKPLDRGGRSNAAAAWRTPRHAAGLARHPAGRPPAAASLPMALPWRPCATPVASCVPTRLSASRHGPAPFRPPATALGGGFARAAARRSAPARQARELSAT